MNFQGTIMEQSHFPLKKPWSQGERDCGFTQKELAIGAIGKRSSQFLLVVQGVKIYLNNVGCYGWEYAVPI